jgi:hypothetical protein
VNSDVLKADERHWRLTDQINTIELRSRILSLIRKGATAEQVSQTLKAGDPEQGIEPVELTAQRVTNIVRRYLNRVHEEDELTLEQLRVLENERLDDLWLQLQRQLRNMDGTLNLKVVDRLTRLSERRARMNGLDAAQRHEHVIGGGLALLGIEEEHLDRAQEAYRVAFERPGIEDAEVVDSDGEVEEVEQGALEAPAPDDGGRQAG